MMEIGFDIQRDLLRNVEDQKSSVTLALEKAKAAAEGQLRKTVEDGLLKENSLHRGNSTLSFATDVPLGSSSKGTSSLEVGKKRAHPSTPDVWRYMRQHGRLPDTTSNVEKALWATRLAFEQGLRELPTVSAASLPDNVDTITRAVYDGIVLLVRCRWDRVYGAPVVFDREFASSWCSVSPWQAKEARYQLCKGGYIIKRGKRGRCYEWLPRMEGE